MIFIALLCVVIVMLVKYLRRQTAGLGQSLYGVMRTSWDYLVMVPLFLVGLIGLGSGKTKAAVEGLQQEVGMLTKEKEDLVSKYENALESARQKRVQLDTVTRQITQLKEDCKTANTSVPEHLVTRKEKQLEDDSLHAGEEALLRLAWDDFRIKFNSVHDTVTELLQQSILARDSAVISKNMVIVREMTTLTVDIRNQFLSSTEECTEKLESVLRLAAPSPVDTPNKEHGQLDAQFLD